MLPNNDRQVFKSKLRAFVALLYVRGLYGGKNIPLDSFWGGGVQKGAELGDVPGHSR